MRLEIPRLVHCYSWPRGKHTTEVVSRRKRMFCVGCVAISFLIYIRVTSFLFFLWFESVMLIAWHISQLFLYVMDGYYIYIYHFFSPPFFGGTPKSHYFFLPLLVDVAGNSSRVMTSRWDSFSLFILQYSAKEDSEGWTSYTCLLALGLTLGCDVLVMPFVHISLRSIANKISIGIFFKVFLFSFEHFFFF
jgi:hypothetical protein